MRTAYQRGFKLGRTTTADLADGFDLAWAAGVPVTDYTECTEDELRHERALVVEALEHVTYNSVMRSFDPVGDEPRAFARIPEHLQEGVKNYLDQHLCAGHFLTAVFEGDLFEAFGRADLGSRTGLWDLVVYLYNHAPAPSFGSKTKVKLWLDPPIPILNVAHVGVDLETDADNTTACPGCGGRHLVRHTEVEPGKITLHIDRQNHRTAAHHVQYVWCQRVHLHVVGIEGKEFTL